MEMLGSLSFLAQPLFLNHNRVDIYGALALVVNVPDLFLYLDLLASQPSLTPSDCEPGLIYL